MMFIKTYRTAAAIASACAIGAGALVLAQSKGPVAGGPKGPSGDRAVTVYKSATCSCCALWVTHLKDNGFPTRAEDVADLGPVKKKHGVPEALASCHTALADGYVVEGHVPASDVRRLLAEKPNIAGLAVPGMPIGSPGMEGPGAKGYDVLSVGAQGGSYL